MRYLNPIYLYFRAKFAIKNVEQRAIDDIVHARARAGDEAARSQIANAYGKGLLEQAFNDGIKAARQAEGPVMVPKDHDETSR